MLILIGDLPRLHEGHPVHEAVRAQGHVRERAADPEEPGRPDRRRGGGQGLEDRAGRRRLAGGRRDDEAQGRRAADPQGRHRQGARRASSSRATSSSTSTRARPSAPDLDDGDTIPASQTSAPVQLDQVLGHAPDQHPQGPAEAARWATAARSTASRSRARTTTRSPTSRARPPARRSTSRSTTRPRRCAARRSSTRPCSARDLHDLSKLVAGQQKVFAALGTHEGSLKDLITNFNTTMAALARRAGQPAPDGPPAAGRARGRQPRARQPERGLPATRAWALEMIPGVRETPATIEAAFPWITPDASAAAAGRAPGAGEGAPAGRSTTSPVHERPDRAAAGARPVQPLPAQRDPAHRRAADPRRRVHAPGCRTTRSSSRRRSGSPGESQNFDGNGSYTRFHERRRRLPGADRRGRAARMANPAPLFGPATSQPLGTRPARGGKPPYKPNAPCYKQTPPNLNAAQDRTGPVRRADHASSCAVFVAIIVPARRGARASPATSCPSSASTCRPGCR